MKRVIASLLFICVVLFAFQGPKPQPIPQCKGEECRDDYGDIKEEQPRFCINFDSDRWIKNCSCMRESCETTYATGRVRHCGKKGCMCDHGCGSTK
jgi:hypothetical protein